MFLAAVPRSVRRAKGSTEYPVIAIDRDSVLHFYACAWLVLHSLACPFMTLSLWNRTRKY